MKLILPALFLIFVTLKLTETIHWSWWAVAAPLYPYLLGAVIWFLIQWRHEYRMLNDPNYAARHHLNILAKRLSR